MAGAEGLRQGSGAGNSRQQKLQLCTKDAECCPTLGVTFCILVMIWSLPTSTSFSTCPHQLSDFVDHEGAQLGSSTLDPKERDMSKRNHCTKAPCELALKD